MYTDNRIFMSGDVAVIEVFNKLAQRFYYVMVDAEDIEKVKESSKSLSVSRTKQTNYCVYRNTGKTIGLHRLIMNTPKRLVVDHLNHNGLDNRKMNLRNCTHKENQENKWFNQPINPTHWLFYN